MDELDYSRPDYFIIICLAFLAGVALESLLGFGGSMALAFVLVGGVAYGQHRAPLVLLLCAGVALGVGRMAWYEHARDLLRQSIPFGSEVSLAGTVASIPERREKISVYELRTEDSKVIRVYAPLYPEAGFSDAVTLSGKIEYPRFGNTAWIGEISFPRTYSVTPCERACGTTAWLVRFRMLFIENIRRLLPEPHASLAVGIVAGRDSFPRETGAMFKAAGISHVVVLSGYNVAVIAETLGGGWLAGVVVILFVIATGAEPSVVRAALMVLAALIALKAGRRYDPVRALLLAALIMVIYEPRLLLFDLSFQLSFLATLGILLAREPIHRRFTKLPDRFLIRESLALTMAAQLFVLPLLVYRFGEISLASFITNVVLVPVVPFAMALVSMAGGIVFISSMLAKPFSLLAYVPLAYIISGSRVFASLPFATVSVGSFGEIPMLLAYIAIGLWCVAAREKKDYDGNSKQ